MKQMNWDRVLGQDRVKEVLGKALANNSLGHAYLLYGEEGCGTLALALELAAGLLCLSSAAVPCRTCESCRKISHYAHPDLHLVFPVALGKESKSSDGHLKQEGWESLSKLACVRIADPYAISEYGTGSAIPVEWIRELTESIRRGAVAGGSNVVVMCGVDLMNKESANALLKTLEEPPADTVLLLCSERPHDVLPTIASRCQILRLGHIPDSVIMSELRQRFGEQIAAERFDRAVLDAQGSLGKAVAIVSDTADVDTTLGRRLLALAEKPDWAIDPQWEAIMEEATPVSLEYALLQCIREARTRLLQGDSQPQTYISIERPGSALVRTTAFTAACEDALRAIRARGNITLVTAHFIMTIVEIFNGKQQQAG